MISRRKVFLASLPVLGRTGALADIARGTPAEGRVKAKTGTLTRVLCLAGVAYPRAGEPNAFALLVNRYSSAFSDMKKQLGRLMVGLCR